MSKILTNPAEGEIKGADIIDFPTGGKKWTIKVGQTLEFEDVVGAELKRAYGFLLEIPAYTQPELLESAEGFKCSDPNCGYTNNVKVAVMQHIKSHIAPVPQKAEPTGIVERRLTVAEARAKSQGLFDADGIPVGPQENDEWYGEGYVEEKPASRNVGGQAGHFGAAN